MAHVSQAEAAHDHIGHGALKLVPSKACEALSLGSMCSSCDGWSKNTYACIQKVKTGLYELKYLPVNGIPGSVGLRS